LSNLLGMLRNSFVALSSKQYFWDFFEDAHVPMPDISDYIRERVKVQSKADANQSIYKSTKHVDNWKCTS